MIARLFVIFFVGFCSLGFSQRIYEQPAEDASIGQLLKHDALSTLRSVKHAFTRPLDWKSDDYIKLGGIVGGTMILSLADEEAERFIDRQRNDFPEVVRDFGWYFGSPQNYFMANAGLYGFGILTKNEKVRKTSVLIISSSITTGLIQSISKNAFGRARPSSGESAFKFKPFSSEGAYHSFPSGHTILSITMAHSIAKQFENPWVKAGIYTIGSIPPISRLIDGAHWLTDIAFGAVISIVVVDSIDKFLFSSKSYDYPKKEKQISWNLKLSTNQIGIVGTF